MDKISDYLNQKNNKYELSFLQIRRAVGVLGIALPVVLSFGTWLIGSCPHIKDSISDYYYTIMGDVFVGILCGVSLFLFSYKGFDLQDKITSNIASVCALGIAFFPDNNDVSCAVCSYCNIMHRDLNNLRSGVHYTSAALFFVTLAYMSLFLFTKTDDKRKMRQKKVWRNRIYITCGIIMLSAIVLMACLKIPVIAEILNGYHPLFWLESLALWAFGLSWLTKGRTIMAD